jgi:hypothetical protein
MDVTSAKLRYQIIIDAVNLLNPKSVIEIGVHNGARARHFCANIQRGGSYRGYDAWDLIEDHSVVYNGKGPGSFEKTKQVLDSYTSKLKVELIQGFTQDTLWGKKVSADFVFIDGDHRTHAIHNDFEAVQNSKLICFDDCVQNGPAHVGAQPIVDRLEQQGWQVIQIPTRVGFVSGQEGVSAWNEIAFAWRKESDCPIPVEKYLQMQKYQVQKEVDKQYA